MGDYSVACSVSNISINSGDMTRIFLLLPKRFRFQKKMVVEPQSMFHRENHYFNPLGLSVLGKYNSYGSLEKVVRDDNVLALERFFDCEIEKLLKMATETRRWNDEYGKIFDYYQINKDLMTDDNILFGKEFLLGLGFVETNTNQYRDKDKRFTVELLDDNGYNMIDNKFEQTRSKIQDFKRIDCGEIKKNFLHDYQKFTDIYLNVSPKHQMAVHVLNNLSSMYVLDEIYHTLVQMDSEGYDGGAVVSGKFGERYEELSNMLKEYERERAEIQNIKNKKNLSKEEQDRIVDVWSKDPFSSFNVYEPEFYVQFKEWSYFKEIYKNEILNGRLKKEFLEHISFQTSMSNCNRMFFPAFNGIPHYGDHDLMKKLYEKGLEILDKKIKEYEEEEED